jgi:hypothetical protein
MDMATASIIVATITAVGGIIVAVINKFRKENQTDHQVVMGILHVVRKSQQRVEDKVDRVDERLDKHLEFHLDGGMLDNERTIHKNGIEATREVSS